MSHHSGVFRSRFLALVTGVVLAGGALAACGSSAAPADDSAASTTSSSESAPESESSESEPAPETEESTESSTEGAAPEQPSYPVTVTADNGEVTIPAQPTRIASLSATATEMLYAIGAGSDVVVVDMYADYPTDLPDARVDAYQLNVEALTQYDPDLVITSYVAPDQQAAFDALKMPVMGLGAPMDMDGAYAQIRALGEATGHVSEADALVSELTAEIADITAQMPEHDTPYTYYYELDQTYYSVTSDTFIGGLLSDLGMVSIADTAEGAAESGGYPQLSAEFILDADPDYILLADTICCSVNAAEVASRDGWGTLSAVADGRVIELDDNIASRWAPRITDLLRTIVKTVIDHPAG